MAAALWDFGVRERRKAGGDSGEEEGDDDGDEEAEGGDAGGFTLDEVLRLGGTKQDYLMLCAVDEESEMVDGGKKDTIDDLKEGELEAFISSLGLNKYAKSCLLVEEDEDDGGSREKEKPPKKEKKKKETNCSSLEGKKEKKGKEKARSVKDTMAGKKKQAGSDQGQQPSAKKERLEEDFGFHARQAILIKPGGKWYDLEYTNEFAPEPQNQTLLSKYKALAQKLYEHETDLFKNKTDYQKGASSAWIKTVVSSGTLADRMAAMTLLIQDSAVHSLQFVENLINLIKKKGSRQQSLMALDTFKELLITDILPDNRKLWSFSQRPLNNIVQMSSGNKDSRDRRLILWYFEHHLKLQIAEFVQALEALSHDCLTATKSRALAVSHELLCNKPEQEKALLVLLVNKLGDPQNKIATKASYLLETLLHKHPNMKGVVCSEVERLLYRSNINNCIKKKDVESKMLSALLCGVNRAYPYAETGDEKVKEQMNTLFKVLHLVNFSTSVQALMLLFQVMDSQQTVSDRYYTALYKKLLDPALATCSKPSMFLNLVYKSLKADVVLWRVKAFVKRLLQVTCGQMPPFICGTLYLLSELLKVKPELRVQLQDHMGSDDDECFKDQEEAEEDEEKFVDAGKEAEDEKKSTIESSAKANNSNSSASWVHHLNMRGRKSEASYDPMHRSPLYCGAENTSLWELKKLSEHFHPSVALFAKTILKGNHIQYSGDPLQDFTLMRFLDRFVYRNPKVSKGKENTSSVVMQPKKKHFMKDMQNIAVNSKEFRAKDESKIPVDEVFFHRFYSKFDKKREKQKRLDDEESVEDVDDDEFERALDTFEAADNAVVGQDDLDFASNIKKNPKGSKKSQGDEGSGADWEDSDDEDDFSDLDDEEVSLGSMEEDFEEDMDEEGGVFMDVSEDDDNLDSNNDKQLKSVSKKSKKKKDMNFAGPLEGSSRGKKRKVQDAGILASAEEFGYLLDENAGSKFDNIGMNAMANRDNANVKQIQWEIERDKWLHNRDVKSIIKKKKQFRHRGLKNKYKSKKSRQ
uniref:CCAAT enhancer binding protein zeta n=1 Tax=Taeniopygia guttata TaxID=59729 RepID=A0A674G892_TAEGU